MGKLLALHVSIEVLTVRYKVLLKSVPYRLLEMLTNTYLVRVYYGVWTHFYVFFPPCLQRETPLVLHGCFPR